MADALELQDSPTFKPISGKRGAQSTGYAQAVELQRILMRDARNPKTGTDVRPAIARAWCALEETKRILRMRPKPADMPVDPVSLARMLKKHRGVLRATPTRSIGDEGPVFDATPTESGEPAKPPRKAKASEPTTPTPASDQPEA